MDQVKEYLNLAIKYRFWIAVGIAALLPVVAFFISAGALDAERKKLEDTVTSSHKSVEQYANKATPVNNQYAPILEKENEVIKSDIDKAHRKLYARQEPFLTWPDEVVDTIPVWGQKFGRDKWPEEYDRFAVEQAIRAYIESYEPYVDEVYSVFKPFDPETGEGIVAAPVKEELLQPPQFEIAKLPTLGKVWAAQERLWIQRVVLEVIAAVNERAGAKDWQSAPIKQVLDLDVASDTAIDQKSLAEGKTLTEAPDILPPGEESAAAEATAAAPSGDGGRLNAMAASGLSPGGGATQGGMAPVKYITNDANPDQMSIAPFTVTVYVQQDAIPSLLAEFANSPMNIQVLEVQVKKPEPHAVKKPKKGQYIAGIGRGMRSSGMGMLNNMLSGGYGGYGMGGADMMRSMMQGMGTSGGYGMGGDMASMMKGAMGSAGGYSAPTMGGRGGRMGPGGAGSQVDASERRKGQDVRAETLREMKAKREKDRKAKETEPEEDAPASKISDPYYDVVEVKIYGQARFYKAPPPQETPTSESGALITDQAAPAEAKDQPEPTAEGEAPAEPAQGEAATPSEPATGKSDAAPSDDAKKEGDTPPTEGDEAAKKDADTPVPDNAGTAPDGGVTPQPGDTPGDQPATPEGSGDAEK